MTDTYNITQHNISVIDGKETHRTTKVEIHGNKGTKTLRLEETGKRPRSKTMRLKPREIACIRQCKFVPGLFKDCETCIRGGSRRMSRKTRRTRDRGNSR